MKKRLLIALVLVLALSLSAAAHAVPQNVQYKSTRAFLTQLDADEIKYTYAGISQNDEEAVTVSYTLTNGSCDVRIFFPKDGDHCSLRLWNLIDFDSKDVAKLYEVCNELNSSYKYTTFYVDTSDYSITVSMDVIVRDAGAGEIMEEALLRMINIADDAMAQLQPYAK